MAIDIGSKTLTGQERSARITRITPVSGDYSITIDRQRIFRDDQGTVVSNTLITPTISLPLATLLASPSTAAYLVACQNAKAITDLILAESVWYDGLVAEARAADAG